MIVKTILLLTVSVAVLGKPKPISVYNQDGDDQQEYQQQQYQPQQQQQQQQYQPQYRQQQPRPQQAGRPLLRQQGGQQQSEDYETEPPQPYQFSFDVNDDENTNYQNRKEQREGNKITGSYSVVDSDGFIRTVTYTADPVEGFKAHVSREPTNIVVKIPEPHQPAQQYASAPKAGVQYTGAAAPRPVQLRPQGSSNAPRRQQTQQYIQGSQDPYAAFQGESSSRVSQAVSP